MLLSIGTATNPYGDDPEGPTSDRWSARARSFAGALDKPLLLLFVTLLGDRAETASRWTEADRAVAFRLALGIAVRVMVRVAAESRGLVDAPDGDTLRDVTSWPSVLDPSPEAAWLFGTLPILPDGRLVAAELRALAQGTPPEFIAVAFESFLARVPESVGRDWKMGTTQDRRDEGAYFTPPPMAHFLAESALRPHIDTAQSLETLYALRVVDPAMGGGAFLIEVLRLLVARALALGAADTDAHVAVASRCLFGVDKDQRATTIARAAIWLAVAERHFEPGNLVAHLRPGDALLGPSVGESEARRGVSSLQGEFPSMTKPEASPVLDLDSFIARTGARDAFSWELTFPDVFLDASNRRTAEGGFDVLLGNPPWGKIKAELKEFYTYLDNRGRDLQGSGLRRQVWSDAKTAESWQQFRNTQSQYARALRDGGAYGAQRVRVDGVSMGGDDDLYKYFLERATQLLKPHGRLGLIVPAAFYQGEGTSGLRALYFGTGEIEDLLVFENRERLFPIHTMFKFALILWQRGGTPGVRRAVFGLTRTEELRSPHALSTRETAMPLRVIRRAGGSRMVLPEVRNRREFALYEHLHAQFPPMGAPGPWNVEFVREFDMTKDSDLFCDADELRRRRACSDGVTFRGQDGARYLPLYEGRLVHQFDHAAKEYLRGEGRRARWDPLQLGNKTISPHYWMPESELGARRDHVARARAGFCDITGHANERTILAALIPAGFPCGNKVPTCAFDLDDLRLPLLWLAFANSFVVDWLMRRRVSTTLNFFHWKLTPFPRIHPADVAARPLWSAAARLSALDEFSVAHIATVLATHDEAPLAPLDARARARLRAQIDVAVADMYQLNLSEFDLVLSDFPLLDRGQPPLSGERRSTITHDLLRATWLDVHSHHSESALLWLRVSAAEARGANAYVPSEQAGHGHGNASLVCRPA